MNKKLYYATGWFNPKSEEEERRVKAKLRELGFDVFSPRDFFVIPENATLETRQKVFEENIKHINDCDIFFGITDYKDMGTLVECGIAFGMNQKDSKKRKLVWYAETLGDNPFNLMLANSGDVIITSFEDLDNLPKYLEKGQIYEGKVQ
jgi:nucleoside deoxyribosyltransferase